ncbi:hypothetical protein [Clostridium akagii]|uniref:hypothetical protein n=1 Tax=Clostridium akagii TaxID=91623 RepID=UPI00047D0DF8|nr:hypothetical protein [Clostridium akagii]
MKGIYISKLRVEGENYRRTLKFDRGLNIISGDIYSGKSLVLRLIDYIFGKEKINLNVQKALDLYCDKVFLEIEINGRIYTFRRNLKRLNSKFYIYFCDLNQISDFTPKVIDKSSFSSFILDLLGMPSCKILKHKINSPDRQLETISIRDAFRFVYVDQHDLGTNNFLKNGDNNKARKNKPTFELITNFIVEDKEGIKEKIVGETSEINNIAKIVAGLNIYLGESDFMTLEDIKIKRILEQEKLDCLIKKKENIIRSIKEKKSEVSPVYKKIAEDIREIIDNIGNINKDINDLELDFSAKNHLLNTYINEKKEIQATKEANYYLEDIKHELQCPLCNSKLVNIKDSGINESILFNVDHELDEKILMLKHLIEGIHVNKEEQINERKYLQTKEQFLQNAAEKYKKNDEIELPYITEIENINILIEEHRKNIVEFSEVMKIYNKIDEKEKERERKQKLLDNLNDSLNLLLKDIKFKDNILEKMNDSYISLLDKLGYSIDKDKTYISTQNYMPYYDEASVFEHDSGGVLVCIQIAFLGAILTTQNCFPEFGLKHPNFLMLDTIGKYLGAYKSIYTETDEEFQIMDEELYKNLYELLKIISNSSQIIIVDNTPPAEEKKYIKYIFKNEDTKKKTISKNGLIDLSKNEI